MFEADFADEINAALAQCAEFVYAISATEVSPRTAAFRVEVEAGVVLVADMTPQRVSCAGASADSLHGLLLQLSPSVYGARFFEKVAARLSTSHFSENEEDDIDAASS